MSPPVNFKNATSTPILTLRPLMKNLDIAAIVLQRIDTTVTKEGRSIHTFLVADRSAAIELSLWDEIGSAIKPSDILSLSSVYCTLFHDRLQIYASKKSVIQRVGEFLMLFNEDFNVSRDVIWKIGNHVMNQSSNINLINPGPVTIVIMTARSYEAFADVMLKKWLDEASKPFNEKPGGKAAGNIYNGVFVYYYATEDEHGISWCPDCVKGNNPSCPIAKPLTNHSANPIVRDVFSSANLTLYQVSIDRPVWKAADQSANLFKSPNGISKLTRIPTLTYWSAENRKEVDRLVESECFDASLVGEFIKRQK